MNNWHDGGGALLRCLQSGHRLTNHSRRNSSKSGPIWWTRKQGNVLSPAAVLIEKRQDQGGGPARKTASHAPGANDHRSGHCGLDSPVSDSHTHLSSTSLCHRGMRNRASLHGEFCFGVLLAIVESPTKRVFVCSCGHPPMARRRLAEGLYNGTQLGHSGVDGERPCATRSMQGRVPGPEDPSIGRKLWRWVQISGSESRCSPKPSFANRILPIDGAQTST